MHIGHYISGAAHFGLIGWALFGGAFSSEAPPPVITGAAMITTEEFEAVLRAQEAPDTATEVSLPEPPQEDVDAPALASATDQPITTPTPPETEAVEPDTTPDLSDITAPEPQDVVDVAPQLPTPDVDTAVVIPDTPVETAPTPAPRVAPEPVAQPEPDVKIAEDAQESTQPDDQGEAAEKPVEETAEEAASTEIITEPKQEEVASAAPSRSVRPRVRPSQPAAQPDPTPTPSESTDDAVTAALEAAAAAASETPRAPSGPPLTQGEQDGLRVAVQECWVVDVGSRAADVTVVVGLSLDQSGKIQGDVRLIDATGGDQGAVQTAFQAARRAVLRCQKNGYDLPIDKYDHWRDVEITFNPENMRRR